MNERLSPSILAEDITAASKYAAEVNVLADLHPDDFIFQFLVTNPVFKERDLAIRYYFYDGQQSARNLRSLVDELGIDGGGEFDLLEFASGYGCVSRHVQKHMPNAHHLCCDIHPQAIEFLEGTLGCVAAESHTEPEKLEIDRLFDVVFALSFFSHMPRSTWLRWLHMLYAHVRPGGYLLFTTQGLETAQKHMGDPEIPADGFWFHPSSEQKDLDVADYGQTIVTEEFVQDQCRYLPRCELVRSLPAFWWGHQDTYAIRKLV